LAIRNSGFGFKFGGLELKELSLFTIPPIFKDSNNPEYSKKHHKAKKHLQFQIDFLVCIDGIYRGDSNKLPSASFTSPDF
jgi:hypothetical protein